MPEVIGPTITERKVAMKERLNLGRVIVVASMLIVMSGTMVLAGNDPSIKGKLREGIQNSMNDFIHANMIDGKYYIYDAVDGKLLQLNLKALHSGIVKKGDFYVSCADFTDADGRLVDLDFLVMADEGQLKTLQALVHAVDGEKRKYHLEQ